jgi:proteasome accessory factor C
MRLTSSDRLQRLLAAIPWIVANDGPAIADVAERFDYPLEKLAEDLETVFLVGVPPYTPDALISVIVEDGRVWISYADYFERPLGLTPDQALALVAAGSSLLGVAVGDDGPLRRGLEKLAGALGLEMGASMDVRLGSAEPGVIEAMRDAIERSRKLRLDYYAYGRDERAERVVRPYRVFAAEGEWYLTAHCESAEAERLFRLDRIHGLELLDEEFEATGTHEPPSVFQPEAGDPRVELLLQPTAHWVSDAYPVEQVDLQGDGTMRVTLAVSAQPWLERLLLRLGPEAELVGTSGALPLDLAAATARQVLKRYGEA